MKYSSGTPLSNQRQQIVSSSYGSNISAFISHDAKKVPYEAAGAETLPPMFQEHPQTLLQLFFRCTLHILQLCQGRFEESLHHNSLPIQLVCQS